MLDMLPEVSQSTRYPDALSIYVTISPWLACFHGKELALAGAFYMAKINGRQGNYVVCGAGTGLEYQRPSMAVLEDLEQAKTAPDSLSPPLSAN